MSLPCWLSWPAAAMAAPFTVASSLSAVPDVPPSAFSVALGISTPPAFTPASWHRAVQHRDARGIDHRGVDARAVDHLPGRQHLVGIGLDHHALLALGGVEGDVGIQPAGQLGERQRREIAEIAGGDGQLAGRDAAGTEGDVALGGDRADGERQPLELLCPLLQRREGAGAGGRLAGDLAVQLEGGGRLAGDVAGGEVEAELLDRLLHRRAGGHREPRLEAEIVEAAGEGSLAVQRPGHLRVDLREIGERQLRLEVGRRLGERAVRRHGEAVGGEVQPVDPDRALAVAGERAGECRGLAEQPVHRGDAGRNPLRAALDIELGAREVAAGIDRDVERRGAGERPAGQRAQRREIEFFEVQRAGDVVRIGIAGEARGQRGKLRRSGR